MEVDHNVTVLFACPILGESSGRVIFKTGAVWEDTSLKPASSSPLL